MGLPIDRDSEHAGNAGEQYGFITSRGLSTDFLDLRSVDLVRVCVRVR